MRKNSEQRKAYSMRRMSASIDRMIVASTPEAKARAKRWADAWANIAGISRAR